MKILSNFNANAVVIVGFWNRYIFNKEWVAEKLFPKKDLTVEIPLDPGASQRISTNDIRIFIVGNQLNLLPINTNNTVLNDIQEISFKIADYFPHTPVTAFGVNFSYEEDKAKVLDNVLDLTDKKSIDDSNYKLRSTTFKHSFSDIEESILNLAVSAVDSKIRFDFNFHYNIKALFEIKEKFTSHSIIKLKNTSEKILNDIYLKN